MQGDERQYARYRQDADVLAEIGTQFAGQVPRLSMSLSRAVAEAAVAAWSRDELGAVGDENHEQWTLRDAAAELALIGLAVEERGEWNGDEVIVDLDAAQISAALRAAQPADDRQDRTRTA
ncbi:hypothetical protein AGRA3207_004201 [Actinomadura graeca]|uniref:Uncharacterized protein n=1 Tax=Actinomadura graeca TaxID=2750812 RepID=A0ABX8QWC4_9ACTN|nr:hypothetical protein [Actinomadura graeca]QXJ23086.1 hypothetical protein AGRA3207_004201 [Actinomadura graeca]